MAQTMRAVLPDGSRTHTVIDASGLPIGPVEEYLAFLRADGSSPHTVTAYARGLAAWWQVLDDGGWDWTDFPTSAFGAFLVYLRTGDLPSTSRVGPAPTWLAPASVQQRAAAVTAFYTWQAAAHGLSLPMTRLYTSWGQRRGRAAYAPMLAGVADHAPVYRPGVGAGARRMFRTRPGPGRPTPVLTPAQVATIIAACRPHGPGPVAQLAASRDRLLFMMLPETGLRLGEALSLRHQDVVAGSGDTPRINVVPRQDHPHGCRVKGSRYRQIYISDALEGAYSAYVWALVDAGIDLDVPDLAAHYVFVNVAREPRWAPMSPDTVYDKIASISKAHPELPPAWSPHWMRHTHATALLLAGVPPHVVMRRLGHADYQTTLSLYGWVTEDAELRAVAEWATFTAGWKGVTTT